MNGLKHMMDDTCVFYFPREGITLEEELAALAACYAFVVEAHRRRKTVAPTDEYTRGVRQVKRRQGQRP